MSDNQKLLFSLGDTIYYYRLKNNLSQEKLSEFAHLHRTYISDVERGTKNITIKNLYLICRALNISLSTFFKKVEEIYESR